MNIAEFRKQYPYYDKVSDPVLTEALHKKYYSHVPYETFTEKFVAPAYPAPEMDVYGGVGTQAPEPIETIEPMAPIEPSGVKEFMDVVVAPTAAGAIETAFTVGSGFANLAAQVPAGFAGLFALIGTADNKRAKEVIAKFSPDITYRPRTEMGERGVQAAMLPFEYLTKGAEFTAKKLQDVAGPKLGDNAGAVLAAMTDASIKVAPLMLPFFRKGLRAMKTIPKGVKNTTWYRKLTVKERSLVALDYQQAKAAGWSDARLAKHYTQHFEKLIKARQRGEVPLTPDKPIPVAPEVRPAEVATVKADPVVFSAIEKARVEGLKTVVYEGQTYIEPSKGWWKDEAEGLHLVKMQVDMHKSLAEGFKEPKHIKRVKEKSFTEELKVDHPDFTPDDISYVARRVASEYRAIADINKGRKRGTALSDAEAWDKFADTGEVPLATKGDYKGKPLGAFQAGVEKFKAQASQYDAQKAQAPAEVKEPKGVTEVAPKVEEPKGVALGKIATKKKIVVITGKDKARAAKFRTMADTLQKQVDAKFDPAISHQNLTARRARIAGGMRAEGEALQEIQTKLRAVADGIESGRLPDSLKGLKNKKQLEYLLGAEKYNRKYPVAGKEATSHYKESVKQDKALLRSAGITKASEFNRAKRDLKDLGGEKPVDSEAMEKAKIRTLEEGLIGTKIQGFFPTPKPVINKMLEEADIEAGMDVLEPSAGKGDIADMIKEKHPKAKLSVVEINHTLREMLRAKGYELKDQDFLEHEGKYDRIIMNPPFEKGQDIDHVRHAYELLKPNGKLVSLMGESTFFRSQKKYNDFREWLVKEGGWSEDVEAGSFQGADSFRQTGIKSRMVTIEKQAEAYGVQEPTFGFSETRAKPSRSKIGTKESYPLVRSKKEGVIKTAITKIESPVDVAHIVASLGLEPQENIMSVIADKNNNVISLYKHTIGLPDQSQAHISSLVGQALNTPKAAKVWVAHNHPSGTITFSSADKRLNNSIANLFEGSNVKYVDMLIVTNKGEYAAADGAEGKIFEAPRGKKVPLVRRRFAEVPEGGTYKVGGPEEAIDAVKKILPKGGLALLDGQNVIVGKVSVSDFGTLRGAKATKILRELEKRNSDRVIAYSPKLINTQAGKNLAQFSFAANIALLDVIDIKGSMANAGTIPTNFGDHGFADMGGYAFTPYQPKLIELPELVEIGRKLLDGKLPKVQKAIRAMGGGALGLFTHSELGGGFGFGKIKLKASIFKTAGLAERVLAHEVGHLIDWLPSKTLKRGNILGHLATLDKYLKTLIAELPESQAQILTKKERAKIRYAAKKEAKQTGGDEKTIYAEKLSQEVGLRELVSRNEVMDELKDLTQRWKPFDDKKAPATFVKYRYSPAELYADAISVLLNDPALLKAVAPKFHKVLFSYIGRKPEVAKAYYGIQERLGGDLAKTFAKRDIDINEMLGRGEVAQKEAMKKEPIDILATIKRELLDINSPLIKKVRTKQKKGIIVPADQNPIYWVEELPYLSAEYFQHLRDIDNLILKGSKVDGITTEDLGKFLFLKRVKGERFEIANPLGQTQKTATDHLAYLEKKWGAEKFNKVSKYAEEFWKLRSENIIPVLEKSGMYDAEAMEKIKDNNAYVTFDVQGYLDKRFGKGVSGKLYKQIGTLNEITNPFTATLLKDAALLRAANTKMTKEQTIKWLSKEYPEDITNPEYSFNGKYRVPLEPRDPSLGMISYLDNGKVKAFYVPTQIADSFAQRPYEAGMLIRGLELVTAPLKEILVGKNPFWIMWNIQRDLRAAAKQLPAGTIPKVIKYLIKAFPDTWDDVLKGMSSKDVRDMYQQHIISVDRHFRPIEHEPETQMERMIMQFGMSKPAYHSKVAMPFIKLWRALDKGGKFSERMIKIASYKLLKAEHPEMSEKEIAHIVRTRGGSPDFLRGGLHRRAYNSLLLFSNAGIQGVRGAAEAAVEHPSAYAWKTFKQDLAPKILMYLAGIGALGLGVKKIMDRIPDRDKTNYITIPLGLTETGKATYFVMPHDFQGQVIAGLFWKALNAKSKEDAFDMMGYIGGEMPYSNLNPMITLGVDLWQYATGTNPYNEWAGRHVIPEQVFLAKDDRARKEMLRHVWNSMGGTTVYRFKRDDIQGIKSELEEIFDYPITEPFARRFVRVSDWGLREQLKEAKNEVRQERAGQLLDVKDALKKLIMEEDLTTEEMALIVTNPDVVEHNILPFIGRRYGNAFVEEFLSAQTTEEKIAVMNKLFELNEQNIQ